MTIRPATADDAERLWAINSASLGYDFPLERTVARVAAVLQSPTNRVFVACDESGRVIGYAHVVDYENTYSESMKNLMALAVAPDARHLGAGRALLAAVEAWARECGCEAVRLVSGMDRTGAHRFYERCGYRLRKEEKNFIKRVAE